MGGFHDSIQKISISFYPLYPPKNDYFGKIWPFWHFLVLFGFFLTTYTPPKKQKKYYIDTILPFWHFLALLGFFLPRITHKKNQKMNILPKWPNFVKIFIFWFFLWVIRGKKNPKSAKKCQYGIFFVFLGGYRWSGRWSRRLVGEVGRGGWS